jgi:transposase-like protein
MKMAVLASNVMGLLPTRVQSIKRPQAVRPSTVALSEALVGSCAMARRRFARGEIASFQWAVARGAKVVDVAREHGFSTATFRRWERRFGTYRIPYAPTSEDRARASAWRDERTISAAWRRFRSFAEEAPWAMDADVGAFDDGSEDAELERLTVRSGPGARSLLVVEKIAALDAVDAWQGSRRPSIAHESSAALAHVWRLPSRWTCRAVREHAAMLRVPIAFFGDLDPQALHAFAALRAGGRDAVGRRPRTPIHWVGLDGRWLAFLCKELGAKEVPSAWTIPLNWLDHEYWQLVKVMLPDVRKLVGSAGFRMLESGRKLELDALVSCVPQLLHAGLVRRLRRVAKSPPRNGIR